MDYIISIKIWLREILLEKYSNIHTFQEHTFQEILLEKWIREIFFYTNIFLTTYLWSLTRWGNKHYNFLEFYEIKSIIKTRD